MPEAGPQRRPLEPKDLLRLCWASEPALSPDGRRVAFTLTRIDPELNEYRSQLWAVEPGAPAAPLTRGEHDGHPVWSPDGRWIAFVRKESAAEGKEAPPSADRSHGPAGKESDRPPQIWLLPTGGGEALLLTNLKHGAGSPAWSPDGRRLAFVATVGPKGLEAAGKEPEPEDPFRKYNRDVRVIERLVYKWDGEGFRKPEQWPQICVIDVARPGTAPGEWKLAGPAAAGEPRQLTSGEFSHDHPSFSADGRTIYFDGARYPDADWRWLQRDIYAVAADAAPEGDAAAVEPRQLTDGSLYAWQPAGSPDGESVAFFAMDRTLGGEYGNPMLYVLDAAAHGAAPTAAAGGADPGAAAGGTAPDAGRAAVCRTAAWDRPLGQQSLGDIFRGGPDLLAWSPDGAWLYTIGSEGGTTHLYRVAAAGPERVERLTAGDRVVLGGSVDPAGRRAALAVADAQGPQELFIADLTAAAPVPEQRLTGYNRHFLESVAVQLPERFRFRAPGGPVCDGWLLKPAGWEPGKRYPAVLQIHGGPMAQYSSAYFFEFQLFAAAGYAVIFTNPRGSLGYGREFCAAIQGNWGSVDYDDLMAGLDAALQANPWIDPGRLAVLGGSYGGYMTAWVVGHTDRFKAGVTMRPVINWLSEAGTEDVSPAYVVAEYGRWWESPQHLWETSPIAYASQITTPLLIEAQEEDYRCPIEQAEQLYAVLKYLKRPVRFVRYPGESHGMSRSGKPWHRVFRLKTNLEWVDKYCKA